MNHNTIVVKIIVLLMICCIPIEVYSVSNKIENRVLLTIDGIEVFPDTHAFIHQEYKVTYVPIRYMSEQLKAIVLWNEEYQEVSIKFKEYNIKMRVDEKQASINGEVKIIEYPVIEENGRVMVPIRFISEVFGLPIKWIEQNRTVNIGIDKSEYLFNKGIGNDFQNIKNNAYVIFSNGWIYYVNIGDESKLYRMTEDGSQNVKLSDDPVSQIQVIDGWVFYAKKVSEESPEGGIYKVKNDGSNRTIVSKRSANFMYVINEKIYFTEQIGVTVRFTDHLFVVNTDGTDEYQITKKYDHPFEFYPYGFSIYYTLNSGFYKFDTTTKKINKITDEYIVNFKIYNDIVYFTDSKSKNIYTMGLDGTNKKLVLNDTVGSYCILNDRIVYRKVSIGGGWSSSGERLYSYDLDTKIKTLLLDKVINYVNVIGDWVYIYSYETEPSLKYRYQDLIYRISRVYKDGSKYSDITIQRLNPYPDETID